MRCLALLGFGFVVLGCSPRNAPPVPQPVEELDCPESAWPDAVEDYESTGALLGDFAPNWELIDQHGCPATFDQFLGAVTLLDISAVWCGPCNEIAATSMEVLSAVRALSADTWSLTILTQNAFNQEPTVAEAEYWVDEYGIEYPVLVDTTGVVPDMFSVGSAYPVLLFIGPDGRIYDRTTGFLEDAAILSRMQTGLDEYGL